MSKIIKKVMKEVNEVVGYKCDICNKDMNINVVFESSELNTLEYLVPSGSYGNAEKIIKHICSKECLKKALKSVPFSCDLHFTSKLLKELVKGDNNDR